MALGLQGPAHPHHTYSSGACLLQVNSSHSLFIGGTDIYIKHWIIMKRLFFAISNVLWFKFPYICAWRWSSVIWSLVLWLEQGGLGASCTPQSWFSFSFFTLRLICSLPLDFFVEGFNHFADIMFNLFYIHFTRILKMSFTTRQTNPSGSKCR